MSVAVLACLLGLALLAWASDHLVLGCAELAERIGLSSLVVGIVVVGFGTSMPEMLVSGLAAASGSAAIGVGNVIGSNLANLTLVLGVAGLVAPLAVRSVIVRREVPLALLASAAFGWAVQGGLNRTEGSLLLLGLGACLAILLRWARQDGAGAAALDTDATDLGAEVDVLLAEEHRRPTRRVAVQALGGLVGTLAGAQALVWGAVGLARAADVPEGFIGVTVVAVGTSLPELVTAAQAARRGEADLIIGNLLGSNMFNALAVGGLVALLGPGPAGGRGLTGTGVVLMLGTSVLALLFMWRRFAVTRMEAALLVAVYVAVLPTMSGG